MGTCRSYPGTYVSGTGVVELPPLHISTYQVAIRVLLFEKQHDPKERGTLNSIQETEWSSGKAGSDCETLTAVYDKGKADKICRSALPSGWSMLCSSPRQPGVQSDFG